MFNTMIAGRAEEQKIMHDLLETGKAEFLAVYGRRRVGKTFLIRNVYGKEIVFQLTGIANGTMAAGMLPAVPATQPYSHTKHIKN